ncbi:hypothetical protein [Mucilaginibacter pedocola]|uniref:Uncharacterized protein n=1 Tax=Mucilaginibacter pedocola TaxID=1792845 RepID=A0A1S9PGH9_9SPHI|nr:hypothetical protein [Mucilaginibacter pedocola]OOQ60073.1 hypothetical protein BC343_27480 [Mucilaginibacter pedocola]
MKQIKQILLSVILLFCIAPAMAQGKKYSVVAKPSLASYKKPAHISPQLKTFLETTARANVVFKFPQGFKEVPAPDNEDFSFDYAMAIPGKDFEIWFQVKSQKENYAAYQRTLGNKETMQDNPDSLYLGLGTAHAQAFAGDASSYFTRIITPKYLQRYNADAGRSYLLNLLDMPITKHYKYGLLITLQKDRTGTILAVCFANDKGPEFFKNIDKASNCLKFKP